MIFYLGSLVTDKIEDSVRKKRNLRKKFEYGYNAELDTVIISKDGTLGEIYNISGINIGLPAKPLNKEDILYHNKLTHSQKWKRAELPDGLNEDTMNYKKFESYIDEEFRRREEGVWVYIKGVPIWITGTYYYGLQWIKEQSYYPSFRIIQNELMIFWEACKADPRCYGMQYVKNRRIGASFLSILELLDSGTIYEDKILGLISKKGDDARKLFRRLIKGFKRLPCFFQPVYDGTNTPKKELILDVPTKRRAKGEVISDDGLGSSIMWHNTEMNAMDGDAIFRSVLDEAGKYPKDVPFSEYWSVVKTSHTKGIRITGKAMVVSTVNAWSKGGSEFKKVWDDSDVEKRNANGQTKSGLYRIFIEANKCLEGMFDQYGFTIIEDPVKPVRTDTGDLTSIGSKTFLKNQGDSLKSDPEKYNEFKRQFPDEVRDAFRNESGDCEFNAIKLEEQLENNKWELEDQWKSDDNSFLGNSDLIRGNLTWENGIRDTKVVWRPDPENGRFFIKKGCFPPQEFKNKTGERHRFGVASKSPLASHIGAAGVDPYNRSRTVDKRGSYGSYVLTTKTHTCDSLPNNQIIVEYIARPRKVELFFEDVIMASVFYSIPFLSEQSNDRFLAYVKDRGYRHFSLNNPFKSTKDLSTAEKEFGGAPQQDAKIRDAQVTAVEAFVEDYIGVSVDESIRPLGQMGDCPFTRTLTQLTEFNSDKRTKSDAFIGLSLSLLANQRRVKTVVTEKKPITNFFQRFDNSGSISTSL